MWPPQSGVAPRNQADLDTAAEEIATATGAEVLPVAADVGAMEQIQAMAQRVRDHFGRIDVLVNNAGTGNAQPFEAMDDDLLGADLQLKLYGAVHCIRAVLPSLKERGGVIINITTPAGKAAPGASVPTSLSRAAGIALTKALANEYAAAGIRVNTVCVSNIRSRQNDRRWQRQHADDPSYTLEQFYQDGGKQIPLGRIAAAEGSGRRDRVPRFRPGRVRHRFGHQRRWRRRPDGVAHVASLKLGMSRKSAPPIDIASMSNSQDQNEQHIVRDIVDNAVVADAYAVAIWARVVNERVYPASDSSAQIESIDTASGDIERLRGSIPSLR